MFQQLVSPWYSPVTNFIIITNNLGCVPSSLFYCNCSIFFVLGYRYWCLILSCFQISLLLPRPRDLPNWSSCPGSCLHLSECFYHPWLALSSVLRRWRWESRRYPYLTFCHTLSFSPLLDHMTFSSLFTFHVLLLCLSSYFVFQCHDIKLKANWPKGILKGSEKVLSPRGLTPRMRDPCSICLQNARC